MRKLQFIARIVFMLRSFRIALYMGAVFYGLMIIEVSLYAVLDSSI